MDIAVNLSMVFSQLTLAGSKYQNETLKILNEQFGCRPTPIHSDILKGIFEKEQEIICIRLQNIDMIINYYDVTKWPLHHGSKYVSSLMCVHAGYCLNATSGVTLLPSQWRVNVWSINIQGGNLPAFGISIFPKFLP